MNKNNLEKFLLLIFFLIILLLSFRTFWTLSHTFTPDFSVYYQAALNIRDNTSVYTGKTAFTSFAYPVVTGIFFIPFSYIPYFTSQNIFLVLNFLALIGISFLIPVIVTRKKSVLLSAIVFSFSYLSFPTKFTLGMGQVNLIAYFFLLLSFFFSTRIILAGSKIQGNKVDPCIMTGLFFAIACLLKPILGFVVLFFIFQKQWRILIYSLTIGIFFVLLSLLVGKHTLQDYFYYFQHMLPEISRPVGKEIYYNQGLISFVFRSLPVKSLRVSISCLGMMLIFLIGIFSMLRSKNTLHQWSVSLSMIPLLDTVSWQHHFIFLIFPFFYAGYLCVSKKKWIQLGLICLAYFLVSWNFAHPEKLTLFPQIFLLSNTFYGGMILFLLLL